MTIELPEHLRTGPLADAAAKALADAASMASASNSVPRVSLRGREFRLIEGGEEKFKFRDTLDVIIFGVEPEAGRMIKTYYKDGYKSGAKEPPTCSSEDGIAPASWVNEKQNPVCQSCPKNAFGSATSPSGKPTKACRDSKRAWFVLADGNVPVGATSPIVPGPLKDRTMYGLNVTVASLKAFSDHGKRLAQLGQGPAVCVTRLKMLDMEYPQLDFELTAWLSAEDAPQSLKISTDRPWRIQYANAGLALNAPDAGSQQRSALPMQVPDHLRNAGQQTQPQQQSAPPIGATDVPFKEAVKDAATNPAAAGNIDDQISNW